MLFKTHLIFGLLAGLYALDFLDINHSFLFMIFVLFASILPDADHDGSRISKEFFPFKLISWLFNHRGIVHSVFIAGILSGILIFFGYMSIGYGLLIGYLSHLIIDGLSTNGVMLFYPFSKFKLRGFIKVGGFIENILFFVILGFVLWKIA